MLWVGVGIYYLKSTRFAPPVLRPREVSPSVFPQPTEAMITNQFDEIEFIVGNFENWEEIEGSPDKYLLLTDPQTGKVFPKIRIGFEFSELFGYDGQKDITVFAVRKTEKETDYEVLYALKYFTNEEIDKLIRRGDWIKIFFQKEKDKEVNAKDENGQLLAHWLMIKRDGGKAEIEQEINREITRPQD